MELIPVGEGYVVLEREEERKVLRYFFFHKRKSKMVYSLWTWRVMGRWKGDYNMF